MESPFKWIVREHFGTRNIRSVSQSYTFFIHGGGDIVALEYEWKARGERV